MKKLIVAAKKLFGLAWTIRRCSFPYANGYATYLPCKRIILDTGLSKEHAKALCDELNGV